MGLGCVSREAFWLSGWVIGQDARAGAIVLAGSTVEAHGFADSGTGGLIFSGSSSESKIGADSATGTLIWGGSRVESATFSQTATGTLIFTGLAVEDERVYSRVQIATFIRVG